MAVVVEMMRGRRRLKVVWRVVGVRVFRDRDAIVIILRGRREGG